MWFRVCGEERIVFQNRSVFGMFYFIHHKDYFVTSIFPLSGVREERLLKIKDQMAVQSPNTRVHFEMASFAEAELLYQLTHYVIPYADSLGMNEQVKEIKL
jgi:aspartate-semialdehyde dehydrogenase